MKKNLEEKHQMILDYDQVFAERLGIKIFKKPQLSVWMILIPIIFVFFLQQLNKYKKDKSEFIKNYLLSPNRALNEAYESIKENREFTIESMVEMADLKPASNKSYRHLMTILTQYYVDLLGVKGDLFGDLIQSAYPEKTAYQTVIDNINNGWSSLNQTIVKDLAASTPEVVETVQKIENATIALRNEDTDVFYE